MKKEMRSLCENIKPLGCESSYMHRKGAPVKTQGVLAAGEDFQGRMSLDGILRAGFHLPCVLCMLKLTRFYW